MFKLFRHLKPFRLAIWTTLLLLIIRSLSDLYLPRITADIVNIGIVNGDTHFILHLGAVMVTIAAFGALASVVASYLIARTANGFTTALRDEVFTKITSFSLQEFDRFGTASLITRTTSDMTHIRMTMDFGLRMMVMAPIMSLGSVALAFSKDPALAVIFVVIIPVLGVIIYRIMQKGLPLFAAMQIKLDTLNMILRERLTGIRVIRAFNRDEFEDGRFSEKNKDYTATSIQVNRIMGTLMPLVTLLMNLAIIAIVWFGAIRIDYGHIQVGDLMAFIQYAMHVMGALVALTRVFVALPRASASATRINEVLETDSEITDADDAGEPVHSKGSIEFRDVTFRYPGAEIPSLANISFIAHAGETTAVIGGTGSGKSTLVHLILRFYDVDSGSILIDGMDIREMTQETLRNKIGYIPQKATLFSGTVADNILYGNDQADSADIKQAAEIAQAADFIENMENGYDSVVAQGGKNISGGQKQRLAIARALIRKTVIYIFDDCFSALDYQTDARLRAGLSKEMATSTVLLISQRVSTIRHADRIIVLDAGYIAGIGTHEELMAENKVYQEIVFTQLSEEEIA